MGNDTLRLSKLQISEISKAFTDNLIVMQALDAAGVMILVINEARQIVYANSKMLEGLGKSDLDEILGMRPGEAISCIHSFNPNGGCGHGVACQNCSALNLILHGMSSKMPEDGDVVIQRNMSGIESAVNLAVKMVPYDLAGGACYLMTLQDSTDKVRRRELERIFFHDVLNATGSIKNYLSLLIEDVPQDMKEDMQFLDLALNQTIEDIEVQRAIGDAENGEYTLNLDWISPEKMLRDVLVYFKYYREKERHQIKSVIGDGNPCICVDQRFLRRILINMVKNALEASGKEDTIELCYEASQDSELMGRFSVWNPGVIDPQIQPRIFSRSFSTKGYGRGVGTYSMKLLGEKYLKAKVGFTSKVGEGTRFYIDLPKMEGGDHAYFDC